MKHIVRISLIISTIIFLITSCKQNKNSSENSTKKDNCDFLFKTNSFSYIFFKGDLHNEIPSLFQDTQYYIIEHDSLIGDLTTIYNYLDKPTDNNNIVRKGIITKSNFTVLIDPEMVIFSQEDKLLKFAEKYKTTIISVIWERLSQTKILIILTPEGLISKTISIPNQENSNNINPNQFVDKSKDEQGLLFALQDLNIPYRDIFSGELKVDLFKLKE